MDSTVSHGKTRAADYAAEVSDSTYHRARLGMAWRLLKRHAPNLSGKNVYDFGCGDGVFMRMAEADGASCVGSDQSEELVNFAPATAVAGGVSEFENQPDGAFDVLIALSVLAYLDDGERDRFWKTAQRTVRPGGVLLQLNPNSVTNRVGGDYKWISDPQTLPRFMKQHGFHEIDRDFIGYYPMIFRWHNLHHLLHWEKIGPKLRLRTRGGRVYNPLRLALVPRSWLVRRTTGYYSIARRVSNVTKHDEVNPSRINGAATVSQNDGH